MHNSQTKLVIPQAGHTQLTPVAGAKTSWYAEADALYKALLLLLLLLSQIVHEVYKIKIKTQVSVYVIQDLNEDVNSCIKGSIYLLVTDNGPGQVNKGTTMWYVTWHQGQGHLSTLH